MMGDKGIVIRDERLRVRGVNKWMMANYLTAIV